MRATASLFSTCLFTATLSFTACGDKKPKEEAKPAKEAAKAPAQPEPEPEKLADEMDLSGPVPPDHSAVFFAVDGAMIPLACFDKDKGKVLGGTACAKLVAKDDTVYLASQYGRQLDKVGDPKNALCELAEKPTSLGTPALVEGKSYEWGVWPKSVAPTVNPVPPDTFSEAGSKLSEEEETAVRALIDKLAPGAKKGNFKSHQRAEVDLGSGTPDLFISVIVAHPKEATRNLFSALLIAPGKDLGALKVVDRSRRKGDIYRLRGAVDLDGDKTRELWVSVTFDGGSGDKVMQADGDKFKSLAKWSCGA